MRPWECVSVFLRLFSAVCHDRFFCFYSGRSWKTWLQLPWIKRSTGNVHMHFITQSFARMTRLALKHSSAALQGDKGDLGSRGPRGSRGSCGQSGAPGNKGTAGDEVSSSL